jgi:bisphosphoglycerate-dependent phosphoglycerate mutase
MQLYIIRHGQSVNNALWSTTGSNENRVEDPELTEMGKRQAELVADYLACTPSSEIRLPYGVPYGTNFGGFSLTNLYWESLLSPG